MPATIETPRGLRTLTKSPEITKYYNNANQPYTSEAQVVSELALGEIYRGLTVNINGVEYWFEDGDQYADLVEKTGEYVTYSSLSDMLLEIGTITLVGNEIRIPAGAKARINNIIYTTPIETVITVPYTTVGMVRSDILVFTEASTIIRLQGNEEPTIAFPPNKPQNTVFVSQFTVTDSTVGQPIDPVTGDLFVSKVSQGITNITGSGVIITLEVDLVKNIELRGSIEEIQNIISAEGDFYNGFDFQITNRQTTDILFKQGSTVQFINNIDKTLRSNETINFRYDANGIFFELGNTSITESFQKNIFFTTSLADLGVATFAEVTNQMISNWRNLLGIVEEDNVNYYFEVLEEITALKDFMVRADWESYGVTDEASFIEYIMYGAEVSDFVIDGDLVTCNINQDIEADIYIDFRKY